MVEVTCRTIGGLYLLRPDSRLNRRIEGILARAQDRTHIDIYGYDFLSNHYHLDLGVRDVGQLEAFSRYVQSNVAREAGLVHDWSGRVWARRYSAIAVSDEERAQIARLRYLLEQGCKENLVASPLDWPGASSAWALCKGYRTVEGEWVDRTAMYKARAAGAAANEQEFTSAETLVLSQIPCWRNLTPAEYRARIQELVLDIERQTRVRHRQDNTRAIGEVKVRAASPRDAPIRPKPTPAPDFHTASKEARQRLRAAYRLFLEAFTAASRAFRNGDRTAVFPVGCFPPRLPFEPYPRARAPG